MDEVAIYVLEGKNLIACDKGGTSDPYVKLAIGHNVKAQTKRIDKTLNPKWNETVYLKVQDASKQTLEVTVWDHDTFRKDDFMGQVNIQLYEAAQLGDSKKMVSSPTEETRGTHYWRSLLAHPDNRSSAFGKSVGRGPQEDGGRRKSTRGFSGWRCGSSWWWRRIGIRTSSDWWWRIGIRTSSTTTTFSTRRVGRSGSSTGRVGRGSCME